MRVFLDTNVLIDEVDSARPSHAASYAILKLATGGRITAVLTGLSIMNTVYAVRKNGVPRKQLLTAMGAVLSSVEVASTDKAELLAAFTSDWSDLEDAVQFQAAVGAGRIDFIITGNVKDFRAQRSVEVLTPQQFLERLPA